MLMCFCCTARSNLTLAPTFSLRTSRNKVHQEHLLWTTRLEHSQHEQNHRWFCGTLLARQWSFVPITTHTLWWRTARPHRCTPIPNQLAVLIITIRWRKTFPKEMLDILDNSTGTHNDGYPIGKEIRDHGTLDHPGAWAVGYREKEKEHGKIEPWGLTAWYKCVGGIVGHWNTMHLVLSGIGGRRDERE